MRKMYSENQLVKVLEGKDVKAKSLQQTQATYSQEISFRGASQLRYENIYSRFEVIGNFLYVIINLKITNTGESSYTAYSVADTPDSFEIASEYASKIYDYQGNTLANATPTNMCIVCQVPASFSTSISSQYTGIEDLHLSILNRTGANKLKLEFTTRAGITINPGDSIYLSARTFISLL